MGKKSKETAERRGISEPVRKEIRGIVFLLIAVFLAVSLFSYSPHDPVLGIKTGQGVKVHNLFGPAGAHLSGWIFLVLGFSSLWLVAVLLVLAFLSFQGTGLLPPLRTIFAALILIVSFSALMGLHLPGQILYRGGKVLSGGLVGYSVSRAVANHLNAFGASVLLAAAFVICLMVCTHFSFGWIFSRAAHALIRAWKGMRELALKRKERARKRKVREDYSEREKVKPRKKVTIVEPQPEPPRKAEQESFPFMNVAGEFKLPPLDLLNAPEREQAEVEIQRESLEANARR
ncbi:MAG: DNA translocase FtsK 4TM domain-containing protein, partial [Deltaproteobacteria bacterium]|nr:DNA translocase FtsK 4TM domain-containing protein [Deltaproteobacteria bacterium]